ncbi:MAG: hypothetical protein EHM42_08995, partial [Planctomycetaceae bacterium]
MGVDYVSNSTVATGTSVNPGVTGFSVTAGNGLIFMVTLGTNRTASGVTDTGSGTWAEEVDQSDGKRTCIIYRCVNHPGGTVDITGTISSSTAWTAVVIQVTGQDN